MFDNWKKRVNQQGGEYHKFELCVQAESPEVAEKCVESWKEFTEWNETNGAHATDVPVVANVPVELIHSVLRSALRMVQQGDRNSLSVVVQFGMWLQQRYMVNQQLNKIN